MRHIDFRATDARRALKHPALKGTCYLARGHFCRVYATDHDTVLKITADPIAYAISADGYRPEGLHFPRLVTDFGDVGCLTDDNGTHRLYLMEMERLHPTSSGPVPIKQLARQLEQEASTTSWNVRSHMKVLDRHELALRTLEAMARYTTLPSTLRQALGDLAIFISNFDDCSLDLHTSNLMRRGDQLILNDVIADNRQV